MTQSTNTPLVQVGNLLREGHGWRIVDCSHDLGDESLGRRAYLAGHIPGAIHAHLDQDLSGTKTGRNGRHPLPEPETFNAWLGQIGIRSTDRVLAYDRSGGAYASRLWWLLRWIGHPHVAVLDGGWQAWMSAGGVLETRIPEPMPVERFPVNVDRGMAVDADNILAAMAAGSNPPALTVVDARGQRRYEGLEEPIDPVAGHIPGALNRPYTDNIDDQGRFKPVAALRSEWDALLAGVPASCVVSQCGSGVTACHNLLALEIAGLQGARLYPGSWSEWCSDLTRPVIRANPHP